LRDDEAGLTRQLVAVKRGNTQLLSALLEVRRPVRAFPRNRGKLHPDAVDFTARAVKADPADLAAYEWAGKQRPECSQLRQDPAIGRRQERRHGAAPGAVADRAH
jgi:hypothetical protein